MLVVFNALDRRALCHSFEVQVYNRLLLMETLSILRSMFDAFLELVPQMSLKSMQTWEKIEKVAKEFWCFFSLPDGSQKNTFFIGDVVVLL